MSAEEYLLQVRKEASLVPDVVVAPESVQQRGRQRNGMRRRGSSDSSGSSTSSGAQRQWKSRTHGEGKEEPLTPRLLSVIQQQQVAAFADARQAVRRMRACSSSSSGISQGNNTSSSSRILSEGNGTLQLLQTVLPDVGDFRAWIDFCTSSDKSDEPVLTTMPLVHSLCKMPQDDVLMALQHITVAVRENYANLSHFLGMWAYALMAALDKPATAQATSMVRTLAKACMATATAAATGMMESRRARGGRAGGGGETLTSESHCSQACDLIVLVAAVDFGQWDLLGRATDTCGALPP